MVFNAEKYKDQMCLKQLRNMRTDESGSFCVKEQEFLLAKTVIGDFEANGVLGLAPGDNPNSIINSLFQAS